METIRGIAVFPGVAIGVALVLDQEGGSLPSRGIACETVDAEISRLERVLEDLSSEIAHNVQELSQRIGHQVALIFEAHGRMISDPHLRRLLREEIARGPWSAETAVQRVLERYEQIFSSMKNRHFADRAGDIRDIKRLVLQRLLGDQRLRLEAIDHEVIVLASDLTPSETASFNPKFVRGIATESGGRTSHTAIVAGAMEIPAVVGCSRFLDRVAPGSMVIVDGHHGVLIVDPDEATIQKYQSSARELRRFAESLSELRHLAAETLDGERIQLMGNIEFPHEAEHCLDRGADGIGLYRTEFLYLDRDTPPDEEEHFQAYAAVLHAMGPERPVVFRTMDLGADKISGHIEPIYESNPFLGLRSIRLSLRNLALFKTQLRAILRASVLGNVRIMFPLVSTVLELRRCKMILADVMEDLEEEGIEFRRDIPVGMMMEVPSAALLADQFASNVDFFSIGTNDLIQYTLACDRNNENVAPLYSASDPAVLRLVRRIVRAAIRHHIEVNVCGEMSGDPMYTMLLIGMGLRQLSVTPHGIPEIKKIIRGVTITEAEKIASRVWRLDTAGAVTNYLRNRTRRIVPELIDDPS